MSDQDTKPLEGSAVAAPVESTEAAPAPVAEDVAMTEETNVQVEDAKPEATAEEASASTQGDKTAETNDNETREISVLNPPKNMLRIQRDLVEQDGKNKANKFDPTVLEESSDPVQIRSQVRSQYHSAPSKTWYRH